LVQLRRFWFPIPGRLGIGITATSLAEARELAEQTRRTIWPDAAPIDAVVEDVDVSTLDRGHVLPNMRPPVWPGVWFPQL
jgi:hypothetical protein